MSGFDGISRLVERCKASERHISDELEPIVLALEDAVAEEGRLLSLDVLGRAQEVVSILGAHPQIIPLLCDLLHIDRVCESSDYSLARALLSRLGSVIPPADTPMRDLLDSIVSAVNAEKKMHS